MALIENTISELGHSVVFSIDKNEDHILEMVLNEQSHGISTKYCLNL